MIEQDMKNWLRSLIKMANEKNDERGNPIVYSICCNAPVNYLQRCEDCWDNEIPASECDLVAYGICSECGERYFHAKTLDAVDAFLLKQHAIKERLNGGF